MSLIPFFLAPSMNGQAQLCWSFPNFNLNFGSGRYFAGNAIYEWLGVTLPVFSIWISDRADTLPVLTMTMTKRCFLWRWFSCSKSKGSDIAFPQVQTFYCCDYDQKNQFGVYWLNPYAHVHLGGPHRFFSFTFVFGRRLLNVCNKW